MKNKESAVDAALLILRLALAAVFIAHGSQKLFGLWGGEGIGKFASDLQGLGVPQPQVMAYVAAITEFAGGILVALGLFARLAALGLAGVMFVAILKVHLRNGFFLRDNGFEYALALWAMSLAIVFAGAGGIAIERLMAKKGPKKVP